MINVIGLGYIGLPTALMFAANGIKTVGTDYNCGLVNTLQKKQLPFEEDGLNIIFSDALSQNNITFSTEYAIEDIYIVAVPTPYDKKTKKVDAKYIINAVRTILKVCPQNAIIVIESTVSPGTIDQHVRPLIHNANKDNIHLVHAPERIIPGNMLAELQNNPRTIGADDPVIGERIKTLYTSFCKGKITVTDIRTAEMSKVIENSFRDINIAFANELAKICHESGLDVYEIIKIANMHPRVNILSPGPGVGGHCISVDPWFLVGDYPGLANIILAARKINDSMPEYVLERISEIMKKHNISTVEKIGLYGLTYKENVNDTRESPTLQLLEKMKKHLAFGIKVYDPYIKDSIVENQYLDLDNFLNDIDLVVIMTAHDELKNNLNKFKNKIILDTRNCCCLKNTYKL